MSTCLLQFIILFGSSFDCNDTKDNHLGQKHVNVNYRCVLFVVGGGLKIVLLEISNALCSTSDGKFATWLDTVWINNLIRCL